MREDTRESWLPSSGPTASFLGSLFCVAAACFCGSFCSAVRFCVRWVAYRRHNERHRHFPHARVCSLTTGCAAFTALVFVLFAVADWEARDVNGRIVFINHTTRVSESTERFFRARAHAPKFCGVRIGNFISFHKFLGGGGGRKALASPHPSGRVVRTIGCVRDGGCFFTWQSTFLVSSHRPESVCAAWGCVAR